MSNYPINELSLMPIFLNRVQTNAEQMWQIFLASSIFHCAPCEPHKMAVFFFFLHCDIQDDSAFIAAFSEFTKHNQTDIPTIANMAWAQS